MRTRQNCNSVLQAFTKGRVAVRSRGKSPKWIWYTTESKIPCRIMILMNAAVSCINIFTLCRTNWRFPVVLMQETDCIQACVRDQTSLLLPSHDSVKGFDSPHYSKAADMAKYGSLCSFGSKARPQYPVVGRVLSRNLKTRLLKARHGRSKKALVGDTNHNWARLIIIHHND